MCSLINLDALSSIEMESLILWRLGLSGYIAVKGGWGASLLGTMAGRHRKSVKWEQRRLETSN